MLKGMQGWKSTRHEGLSIEHFRLAGLQLACSGCHFNSLSTSLPSTRLAIKDGSCNYFKENNIIKKYSKNRIKSLMVRATEKETLPPCRSQYCCPWSRTVAKAVVDIGQGYFLVDRLQKTTIGTVLLHYTPQIGNLVS